MDGKETSLTTAEKGANPGIQRKAKHLHSIILHHTTGGTKDKATIDVWKEKRIKVTGVWRSMNADGVL